MQASYRVLIVICAWIGTAVLAAEPLPQGRTFPLPKWDEAQVREDAGRLEAYQEKVLAAGATRRDTAPRALVKRWKRQFKK